MSQISRPQSKSLLLKSPSPSGLPSPRNLKLQPHPTHSSTFPTCQLKFSLIPYLLSVSLPPEENKIHAARDFMLCSQVYSWYLSHQWHSINIAWTNEWAFESTPHLLTDIRNHSCTLAQDVNCSSLKITFYFILFPIITRYLSIRFQFLEGRKHIHSSLYPSQHWWCSNIWSTVCSSKIKPHGK